jgi:hypothetical protein
MIMQGHLSIHHLLLISNTVYVHVCMCVRTYVQYMYMCVHTYVCAYVKYASMDVRTVQRMYSMRNMPSLKCYASHKVKSQ